MIQPREELGDIEGFAQNAKGSQRGCLALKLMGPGGGHQSEFRAHAGGCLHLQVCAGVESVDFIHVDVNQGGIKRQCLGLGERGLP